MDFRRLRLPSSFIHFHAYFIIVFLSFVDHDHKTTFVPYILISRELLPRRLQLISTDTMGYVRSRKFCCCIPVRFGAFIMSSLYLVVGIALAAASWYGTRHLGEFFSSTALPTSARFRVGDFDADPIF